MLADPKARGLAERFALQWLDLAALGETVKPDAKRYPQFTPKLADAMKQEAILLVDKVLREDRPLTELLSADYTFVNADLAKLYGLKDVTGGEMRPVKLPDRTRGGLLAWPASTRSPATRCGPARCCGASGCWPGCSAARCRRRRPTPGSCRRTIRPATASGHSATNWRLTASGPSARRATAGWTRSGSAWRTSTPSGRWRTKGRDGPADRRGRRPARRPDVQRSAELRNVLLSRKDEFERNVTKKLLGYALGRDLRAEGRRPGQFDQCVVDDALAAMKKADGRSAVVLETIALSKPFGSGTRRSRKHTRKRKTSGVGPVYPRGIVTRAWSLQRPRPGAWSGVVGRRSPGLVKVGRSAARALHEGSQPRCPAPGNSRAEPSSAVPVPRCPCPVGRDERGLRRDGAGGGGECRRKWRVPLASPRLRASLPSGLGFLFFPNGVWKDTWFPKQPGKDFDLPFAPRTAGRPQAGHHHPVRAGQGPQPRRRRALRQDRQLAHRAGRRQDGPARRSTSAGSRWTSSWPRRSASTRRCRRWSWASTRSSPASTASWGTPGCTPRTSPGGARGSRWPRRSTPAWRTSGCSARKDVGGKPVGGGQAQGDRRSLLDAPSATPPRAGQARPRRPVQARRVPRLGPVGREAARALRPVGTDGGPGSVRWTPPTSPGDVKLPPHEPPPTTASTCG